MSPVEVVVSVLLAAIPIALSVWAMLDAARRPEWAFSFVNRSRTVWVAACAIGVLFCVPGLLISLWYLLRVRPQVAGVEAGRLPQLTDGPVARHARQAQVTRTGRCLMPLMKLERRRSIGPSTWTSARRGQQLLVEHLQLHAGELGAEAEVGAEPAEGDVVVRGAADVEAVRIGELRVVEVRRDEPDHHLVPGRSRPGRPGPCPASPCGGSAW